MRNVEIRTIFPILKFPDNVVVTNLWSAGPGARFFLRCSQSVVCSCRDKSWCKRTIGWEGCCQTVRCWLYDDCKWDIYWLIFETTFDLCVLVVEYVNWFVARSVCCIMIFFVVFLITTRVGCFPGSNIVHLVSQYPNHHLVCGFLPLLDGGAAIYTVRMDKLYEWR